MTNPCSTLCARSAAVFAFFWLLPDSVEAQQVQFYPTAFGAGCGVSPPPSLAASGDPACALVGNESFTLVASGLPSSSTAVSVVGIAKAEVTLPGGCQLLVDPANLTLLDSAMTSNGGFAVLPTPIPNNPNLAGLVLVVQVAGLVPGQELVLTQALEVPVLSQLPQTLDSQPCPLAADPGLVFQDTNLALPTPFLGHPTTGAVNADGTHLYTTSGMIFDADSGVQDGFLGTGGGASQQQWSNLTPNLMYYVHADGSFRRQHVYGFSDEAVLFTPQELGYTQVLSGPFEGLLLDDQDRLALFMGLRPGGEAEIFLWDLQAQVRLPQTRPVNWGAHDFISLTHGGQFVAVKSVPQGSSNGPWWFYPVTNQGLGDRVVAAFPQSHHAGPAREAGVDRWVDAGGRVFDMQSGTVLRTLCGFWSLGQHVHGVRGLDAVVGSNSNRLSLVWTDGSGATDLGPMIPGGESYAQISPICGGPLFALFEDGGQVVRREY